MHKFTKLVSSVFLAFSLVACDAINIGNSGNKEHNNSQCDSYSDIGEKYLCKIKTFSPNKKNIDNSIDDEAFNDFLNDVFYDSLSESYVYMHFNTTDYKSFNVEKPEVAFGSFTYGEDTYSEYIDTIDKLESYNYDTLSYRQQYYYDMYLYSLYETVLNCYYDKYSLLFSGSVDVVANTIDTLINFPFYDKESIDDYVTLLNDVSNYLSSCLQFTEKQAENGLYHTDASIDYVQDYIDEFTFPSKNSLIEYFEKSMEDIDYLTPLEKENYIESVTNIVNESVVPSLKNVSVEMEKYRGKTTPIENALCNIDKNYAEAEFILSSSSNKTIENQLEQLESLYNTIFNNYIVAWQHNAETKYNELSRSLAASLGNSYENYLEYLKEELKAMYPELMNVQYDVDAMDESTSVGTTLAYYMSSPLDDLNKNVIRVNEKYLADDPILTLSTLAHEGFPGHLYQHIYVLNTQPHMFVHTQSFGGYTEGYAVRAQTDMIELICDDKYIANFASFDNMYYFIAYSILDIYINYMGYDEKQIASIMEDMGFDGSMAVEMIEFLTDLPTVYSMYGCGYTEFTKLRDDTKKTLGDKFNIVDFNNQILSHGELPFVLVKQAIDEYISSK